LKIKVQIASLLIFTILAVTVAKAHDFWTMTNCPDTVGYYCTATTSNGILFAGTNLGAYRSFDNGNTWEFVLSTGFVEPFFITEKNVIYAGAYPYCIFYSSDYGGSWDTITAVPFTSKFALIKPSETEILYGGWQGMYKSSDNGSTWNLVFPSTNNNSGIFDIAIHPNGNLFACNMCPSDTTGCGVYVSEDNGDTWQRTNMNHEEYIVTLEINSKGDIFAGSRGHYSLWRGAVLKSSDLGKSWTILKEGPGFLVTTMDITDFDDIFIGCSADFGMYGGVFRSADNGLTWEDVSSGITTLKDIRNLNYCNDGFLYSVTGIGTQYIYRSENLIAGTYHYENTACDVQVFPNPFKDLLIINSDARRKNNDEIKINIYNITGHCVYDFTTSGGKTTIDTSCWPKGIYMVILRNSNDQNLHKIIKESLL